MFWIYLHNWLLLRILFISFNITLKVCCNSSYSFALPVSHGTSKHVLEAIQDDLQTEGTLWVATATPTSITVKTRLTGQESNFLRWILPKSSETETNGPFIKPAAYKSQRSSLTWCSLYLKQKIRITEEMMLGIVLNLRRKWKGNTSM
jgi:hypothetical protein